MTRLNIAIMENDGFTETIAGYLSDFSMLRQRSFDQDEVSDNSTSEKMEVSLVALTFEVFIISGQGRFLNTRKG